MPLHLETDRLQIRLFTAEDLEAFHAVFGDPEVMRWVPSGASPDLEGSRERLDKVIAHQAQHGFSQWAVVERATGEVVGSCGLMFLEEKGPEVELAYHLARSRWGRGYISEAAAACIDYGFEYLGIDEIVAVTDPDHFLSRRIMEKVGMEFDGLGIYYGRRMARYTISTLGSTA